jgi:Fic/DOC family
MTVPPLPPLQDDGLKLHARVHDQLAQRWDDSTDVLPLMRFVQHRVLVESHAKVQPVDNSHERGLFPRPRSFLTTEYDMRLAAAEIAFRYIDTRAAMVDRGELATLLDTATPQVLNAILEGAMPTGIISNAGILRATQSKWHPDKNPMQHPLPHEVPGLVDAAIDLATRAPAPAIARAGWLAFTLLCIHPFVDGNGRTARMLFQGMAAADTPLGVDWGAVEQFSLRREDYVTGLKSGQQVKRYDPSELDPLPFMEFALECSIDGAILVLRRLESLLVEHQRLADLGWNLPHALVSIAVRLSGSATLADLDGLGFDAPELTAIVNELVTSEHLCWANQPAGRSPVRAHSKSALIDSGAMDRSFDASPALGLAGTD